MNKKEEFCPSIEEKKPNISSEEESFEDFWDHVEDIIQHKERVKNNALILAKRLAERGERQFAKSLIKAAYEHDASKFFGIEFDNLRRDSPKDKLKQAHIQHVETNQHHAEFWGGIENMGRLFIAELVCDLKARSEEFGTDLREYVKGDFSNKNGLNCSCKVYKTIKDYLDLLLESPFKKI